MRKNIIISIVILLIIFGWGHIRQKRQFYYVANDMYITIWNDYIILGKYTSFFYPNDKDNYVIIPSRTGSVDLCFEDSSTFVLYSSSEKELIFSLQNYHLTKLYKGEGKQYLDFLNYKNIFYANNPYCEISLSKERGRYVPYIDVFYDSVYVRTAYVYEDLLQNMVDSSEYTITLKNRITNTQKEIEREIDLQNRLLKKQ